ncbi:MAG TPA: MAPEG family protein [Aquirhabdus sp.]
MNPLSTAIYAMVAACVLPFLTAALAKIIGRFQLKDNENPRDFQHKLKGAAARINAAQMNSYETLPVFLAAVLTAEYMVVPQPLINYFAWAYVFLRVLYTAAYGLNLATFRSIIWTLAFFCPLYLFYMAAKL